MRILIAPDKFKGSLKASEAAAAIREGFARVFPNASYELAPIADGGEGTGAVFHESMNGEEVKAPAHDALGRSITASYSWIAERKMAVIEMSEASGLWRLEASELNPLLASTFGTGELIAHAIAKGAETILVAIGGSATNDAGVGMAMALGWKFLDSTDNEMHAHPGSFSMIRRIVPPAEQPAGEIIALCDVSNPLLGKSGATMVYGPQKGASGEMLDLLEMGLAHLADVCRDQLHHDYRSHPGAGAAGGLGFGLLTFCGARIQQGFETVAGILDLKNKIAEADLVITGEGKLDAQTLHGKGPAEVARLARLLGKPTIAFAGKVEGSLAAFDACIPIADGPLSFEQSRDHAGPLLRDAAERAARLITISI